MTESHDRARASLAEALDLDVDNVEVDASITSINAWDSIGHMRLILAIENNLGTQLDPEIVVTIDSVRDIAAVLENSGGSTGQ